LIDKGARSPEEGFVHARFLQGSSTFRKRE
jgi:hypothetical protein